jgi:hypothetical protein
MLRGSWEEGRSTMQRARRGCQLICPRYSLIRELERVLELELELELEFNTYWEADGNATAHGFAAI